MLVKTEAIVLQSIRYNEADLIVKCYTKSHGLASFMVKGVLKSKKAKIKPSYFQVFSLLSIEAQIKNKGSLEYFKDVQIFKPIHGIQTNVYKSGLAIFLTEILKTVIYEEEKNINLFSFIEEAILELNTSDKFSNFHLVFLLELTKFLGFYPSFKNEDNERYFNVLEGVFLPFEDKFCLNKEFSDNIKQILSCNLRDNFKLKFNREERRKMVTIILNYYEHHIENFSKPKSIEVLNSLF